MKNIIVICMLLVCSTFFVSCAGLSQKKNVESITKIRRVAVVSFETLQPAATGSVAHRKGEVGAMAREFVKAFGQQVRWQVLPLEKVTANAAYRSAYNKKMNGFHNKSMTNSDTKKFVPENVLDYDSMRILGTEGRTELIRALKVDAIVAAQVRVEFSGGMITSLGKRHPQAKLMFEVYTANKSSADWFEGNIEGEESKKYVGITDFFDPDELALMALESAKSAFAKIKR